jgi:hypothetical protein
MEDGLRSSFKELPFTFSLESVYVKTTGPDSGNHCTI